jgi:hypothetical protein
MLLRFFSSHLVPNSDGDVDVAAHLALFHVGVADAAVDEDLLERGEIGEGFLGGGDVGFADDFHERGAGAVEVDAAGAVVEVERFGDVFLEVNADEADGFVGDEGGVFLRVLGIGEEVERDGAAEAEGLVVLGDLVILRHVRVEIIFAVELAALGDAAAEHFAGEDGFHNRLFVRDRQHAGHPEADRADMGIDRAAELVFAAAEHLGVGLELDVNFQADDGFVGRGGESLVHIQV